MFTKHTLPEFESVNRGTVAHFFGRASFETRSTEIPSLLFGTKWTSFIALKSARRSSLANLNATNIEAKAGDVAQSAELDTSEPLQVARVMRDEFLNFAARANGESAIIDITSFRREELLILYSIMKSHNLGNFNSWEFAYVGAQGMGHWLSGKVTSVRSVFGFPGDMWPSRNTRLVILMGFELERARSIVEVYEPATVLLGLGKKSESISDSLYERNVEVANQLALEIGSAITKRFEFSARDPSQVVHDLELSVANVPMANTIIAPLHTKLSTLGAGMYAIKHPECQICYAAVDAYNEEEYSRPGNAIYTVPVKSILDTN